MFGFSKREKVSSSIRKAMQDVLNSRFATPAECKQFCQTDEGAAWLLTEIQIQLTNALGFVISSQYENHSWSNLNFFVTNIRHAFGNTTHDSESFLVIIDGIKRLQSVEGAGEERMQNVYRSSAEKVYEHDPSVDRDNIVDFIAERTEKFMNNLGEYFS